MSRKSNTEHMQEASLDGVSEITMKCDNTDFIVESDPSISGVLRLLAEPAMNAPVLSRSGSIISIEQNDRYRGSAAPILRLPEGSLPGLSGVLGQGDVTFEGLQLDIGLKVGQGDVRVVRGSGSLSLAVGHGDVQILQHRGAADCKAGSGDAHFDRCDGPVSIQIGSGDVMVSEGGSELVVQSGSGDVVITRPSGQSVRVDAGKGDVTVKDGSVSRLNIKIGKGDIHSQTRFSPTAEPEAPDTEAPDAEFEETGESVRFNLADLQFEAGEGGVRIARGGRDMFRAGPEGVRIRREDGGEVTFGPSGIQVGEKQDRERFSFVTDKGDVAVDIPDDLPVRVEVVINRGSVTSDVPLLEVGRPGPRGTRRRYVGVGDANEGERVLVRTRSDRGDVILRLVSMSGSEPTPSQPTGASADRDAHTREVLESLARGRITAAEADMLLQAIDRES